MQSNSGRVQRKREYAHRIKGSANKRASSTFHSLQAYFGATCKGSPAALRDVEGGGALTSKLDGWRC